MWQIILQLTFVQIASMTVGAVVGLISVTIFAVILRRIERSQPSEAVKALRRLIYLVLGAGLIDYAAFDAILKANAIFFYLFGLGFTFIPLGLITFASWTLRGDR